MWPLFILLPLIAGVGVGYLGMRYVSTNRERFFKAQAILAWGAPVYLISLPIAAILHLVAAFRGKSRGLFAGLSLAYLGK